MNRRRSRSSHSNVAKKLWRTRARAYRNSDVAKAERKKWGELGFEPGEAYRGLWLHLVDCKRHIEGAKIAKNEERERFWKREYSLTLHRIMPYERPRLTTVKVQGDANAPLMSPEALAESLARTLTIAELEALDALWRSS
jgi:hypothetical protein